MMTCHLIIVRVQGDGAIDVMLALKAALIDKAYPRASSELASSLSSETPF